MSVIFKNVTHTYMKGSPFERKALDDINLNIDDSEMVGLIGHTGSGKSTLMQHINGLLKAQTGKVIVNGKDLSDKTAVRNIRHEVGMVFQFPEHQLFEETVRQDIAFGPANLGYNPGEINERVLDALHKVGLDDDILERSPFELSDGQKRRAAIAGVIAMTPSILILDEPTAGLDPAGGRQILEAVRQLHNTRKITVILVSHNMEEIAGFVDRIVVMNKGRVEMDGQPEAVFSDAGKLSRMGLSIPQITCFMRELKKIRPDINGNIFTVEDAKRELLRMIG